MYNHAPKGYICPFCLIVQGVKSEHVYSVESDMVHRGEMVTAFISSHQWTNNPGNTIIVPNEHYENLYDLPARFAAPMHELAQVIAIAMKRAYGCDGVSTRQHNEPAGSQDVWHYHLHVTPRYAGDHLYRALATHRTLATQRALMPPGERAAHAQKIRAHLPQ